MSPWKIILHVKCMCEIFWHNCLPVITNFRILVTIYRGTPDWHCNWRLFKKIELHMISVKLPFTSIYFYFRTSILACTWGILAWTWQLPRVMKFHGADVLRSILIHRVITYIYTHHKGYKYTWLWNLYPVWLPYVSRYCHHIG